MKKVSKKKVKTASKSKSKPIPRKAGKKKNFVRMPKKAVKNTLKKCLPKAKVAPAKSKKAGNAVKEKAPLPPPVDTELLRKRIAAILSVSDVRQMLIGLGGENALAIIRNFEGNRSDDEFAKKLKIKISDVRATLNKLHNEGLVNYIREKDSETGWYSYSWTLNHERMERWATSQSVRLTGAGDGDTTEHYFCPSCGTASITSFESAVTCEFRCERCNKMLEYIDQAGITELFEKKK